MGMRELLIEQGERRSNGFGRWAMFREQARGSVAGAVYQVEGDGGGHAASLCSTPMTHCK